MSSVVHSIIIPHRSRVFHLSLCLAALAESAHRTPHEPFEVVVVEPEGEGYHPALHRYPRARSVKGPPMRLFNKSVLLNIGIAAASGEMLTFLDADAIVGPGWFSMPTLEATREFHRLCYRGRYAAITEANCAPEEIAKLRSQWDSLRPAFEAWGDPIRNRIAPESQPWGNSQFTIHRDRLAGDRYDEAYVGRGFEDLDLSVRLWKRWGDSYRGAIATHPDHAIIHATHEYADDWRSAEMTAENLRRFRCAVRSRS